VRRLLLVGGLLLTLVLAFLIFMAHNNTGVPVLMYHMVSDWSPRRPLDVPVKEFERQMWYLHRRGYTEMPLAIVLARLSSGEPLPPKTVALTFDDGYMDNYLNAFPILKKYHYPATVFMPANLVDKENLWDIKRGKKAVKMLTRDQIAEMLQNNISFQAHTYNHVVLIDVPLAEAKAEIYRCKELAALTGQPLQIFCYPSGRYSQPIKGLVQEAGFTYAFSTRQGRLHAGDDLYSLKRIRVTGLDLMPKFMAHLEIIR